MADTVADPVPFDYIICIDFEATCDELSEGHGALEVTRDTQEIIEFPWVVLNARTMEITDSVQLYVKPERTPVTEFCTQLTGITAETLEADGVSFAEAVATFARYADERLEEGSSFVICAHGSWDVAQLRCEAFRKGVPLRDWMHRFVDLRQVFRFWAAAKGWAASGTSLQSMCDALGIPLSGKLHSGIDDATTIANCLARVVQVAREQQQQGANGGGGGHGGGGGYGGAGGGCLHPLVFPAAESWLEAKAALAAGRGRVLHLEGLAYDATEEDVVKWVDALLGSGSSDGDGGGGSEEGAAAGAGAPSGRVARALCLVEVGRMRPAGSGLVEFATAADALACFAFEGSPPPMRGRAVVLSLPPPDSTGGGGGAGADGGGVSASAPTRRFRPSAAQFAASGGKACCLENLPFRASEDQVNGFVRAAVRAGRLALASDAGGGSGGSSSGNNGGSASNSGLSTANGAGTGTGTGTAAGSGNGSGIATSDGATGEAALVFEVKACAALGSVPARPRMTGTGFVAFASHADAVAFLRGAASAQSAQQQHGHHHRVGHARADSSHPSQPQPQALGIDGRPVKASACWDEDVAEARALCDIVDFPAAPASPVSPAFPQGHGSGSPSSFSSYATDAAPPAPAHGGSRAPWVPHGGGFMGGRGGTMVPQHVRAGDWQCPGCWAHNYASRTACFKCSLGHPGMAPGVGPGAGPGGAGGPFHPGLFYPGGAGGYGFQPAPFFFGGGFAGGAPPPPWFFNGAQAWDYGGGWQEGIGGGGGKGGWVGHGHGKGGGGKGEWGKGGGKGKSKGGGGGQGGPVHSPRREGDWDCVRCSSHNFTSRTACFRCSAPMPGR